MSGNHTITRATNGKYVVYSNRNGMLMHDGSGQYALEFESTEAAEAHLKMRSAWLPNVQHRNFKTSMRRANTRGQRTFAKGKVHIARMWSVDTGAGWVAMNVAGHTAFGSTPQEAYSQLRARPLPVTVTQKVLEPQQPSQEPLPFWLAGIAVAALIAVFVAVFRSNAI